MRALIGCPKCESEGRRYVLGELAPTGHVLIQRVHGKNGEYRNFTIVGGNDFYLICDHCGETIYFKKINDEITYQVERRNNESSDNGSIGLYRETFIGTLINARAYSGTATPGTII